MAFAALAWVAFVIACSGADNNGAATTAAAAPTASTTSAASATPTSTSAESRGPYPALSAAGTGIPAVDAAIRAAERGNFDALRALVVFTPMPCVAEQIGIGAPPKCRAGETEGTLVDALPTGGCEGGFARADELTLDAPGMLSLFGVYRAPVGFYRPGQYLVVLAGTRPGEADYGLELVMTDAGVIAVQVGCGQTPRTMAAGQHLTDAIYATD